MQQWNDQGYFTDNLMMKRVDMDTNFMPLSEIKRRAQTPRMFLSILSDNAPPPGLGPLPSGAGINHVLQQRPDLDSSRHSSPQAVQRNAVVESFLNPGSMATGSTSPSSSLGNGLARGPGTPESIAMGSRLANRFASESSMGGRTGMVNYSPADGPVMPQAIRHIHNDVFNPSRSSSYDTHQNAHWQPSQGPNVQAWLGGTENAMHQFSSSTPEINNGRHDAAMGVMPSVDPFLGSQDPAHAFYPPQSQAGINNGMHYMGDPSQQTTSE